MHLLIIDHHTRFSIHYYLIIFAICTKRFNQKGNGRSKDYQTHDLDKLNLYKWQFDLVYHFNMISTWELILMVKKDNF